MGILDTDKSRVIMGVYGKEHERDRALRDIFGSESCDDLNVILPPSKRLWVPGTKGLLSTENDIKVGDNDRPLREFDFPVISKKLAFSSEDSPEDKPNAIAIARDKVIKGILQPWDEMTEGEREKALHAIGAESAQHVIAMAEDRELRLNSRLRHAEVWTPFKNLPLVREAFQSSHIFPGKRINELVNAVGGVINFLDMLEKAKQEMREKGYEVEDTHTSYITYFLTALEPGLQSLPEEGMWITASEYSRIFYPVTREDRQLEENGHEFELDDFDVPADYQGEVDQKGRPLFTIEKLRGDRDTHYFDTQFPAARAMRTFAETFNIPVLDKPREERSIDIPGANFVSNLNFGEWAGVYGVGLDFAGYQRVSFARRIESIADLETGFSEAEGTLVEPFPTDIPAGVSPLMYRLARRLETALVISNRVTLKPLAHENAFGRPVLIHHDVRQEEMSWYFDAAKFRTIGTRSDMVFDGYRDEAGLKAKMVSGKWDEQKFTPNSPVPPPFKLKTREDLLGALGRDNLGFVAASFASASSHIPSGNNDALKFANLTARYGVTLTHGGGGRYIMFKNYEGPAFAYHDGFSNFINIAVRTDVASRKEGTMKPVLAKLGMSLDGDSQLDDAHYSFGNGRFHVFTEDHIGERQHLMLGPAHAAVFFIGGAGTKYEFDQAAYHNAMVELRGYGIRPGFDNHSKIKLLFVNSEVENGFGKRGYFDVWRDMFSEEEREVLDMHFFDTPEEAFDEMLQYSVSLGFKLEEGKPQQHVQQHVLSFE